MPTLAHEPSLQPSLSFPPFLRLSLFLTTILSDSFYLTHQRPAFFPPSSILRPHLTSVTSQDGLTPQALYNPRGVIYLVGCRTNGLHNDGFFGVTWSQGSPTAYEKPRVQVHPMHKSLESAHTSILSATDPHVAHARTRVRTPIPNPCIHARSCSNIGN